jgi:prepilin-type N-terminal cleavage/methylation domain-containing protein/prepilin-type processing-associated H-X9-DG protein
VQDIVAKRRGLTLVELLVVLAIIGLLAGLVLAAVQRTRENVRAAQCRSHLRQIGIALHNYHGAHKAFPPGCLGQVNDPVNIQGWGWGTLLLPYLEEQSLYKSLDPNQNSLPAVLATSTLQPYLLTPLSIFRCASDLGDDLQSEGRTLSGFVLTPPAIGARIPWSGSMFCGEPPLLACIDPVGPIPPTRGPIPAPEPGAYGVRAATSNYVASFGDYWQADPTAWTVDGFAGNGAFGSNVARRLADITDGASHTFAVGERSWDSFASIWAGTDGWNRCEREGVAMTMSTAFYPMNSNPEPYYLSCDPKGAAAFGSMHSGGANFLMVDGSVRFVDENIDFANSTTPSNLGVYQRLARRNDGLPAGDP